jgi:uncharacterized membrane protein YccC
MMSLYKKCKNIVVGAIIVIMIFLYCYWFNIFTWIGGLVLLLLYIPIMYLLIECGINQDFTEFPDRDY